MGTVESKGKEYFSIHGEKLQRDSVKKKGSEGNIAHIVSTVLSQEKPYSYRDLRDLQIAFAKSMKERFTKIGQKSSNKLVRSLGKGLGAILNKLYRAWNKSRAHRLDEYTKYASLGLLREKKLDEFLKLSPIFSQLTDRERDNLLNFVEGRLETHQDLRDKFIQGSETEIISYFQQCKKALNDFEMRCKDSGKELMFTARDIKHAEDTLARDIKHADADVDEIFQGKSLFDIRANAKEFICKLRNLREEVEREAFSPVSKPSVEKHIVDLTEEEKEALEKLEIKPPRNLQQQTSDQKVFENEKETKIALYHWIECKIKMRLKAYSLDVKETQQKVIENVFSTTVQKPSDEIGDVEILNETHPDVLFIPHMVVKAKDGEKYVFLQKEEPNKFFRYKIKKGDLVPEPATNAQARLHLILKLFDAHETNTLAKYIKESMLVPVDKDCIPLLRKIIEKKDIKNPELLAAKLRAAYHLTILGERVEGLKDMLESYLKEEEKCSLIQLLDSEREVLCKACGKEYTPKNVVEEIEAPQAKGEKVIKPPAAKQEEELPETVEGGKFAGHFPAPLNLTEEQKKALPLEAQVEDVYKDFKQAFEKSLLKKTALKSDHSFDLLFPSAVAPVTEDKLRSIQKEFENILETTTKEREEAFSHLNGRLARSAKGKELPSMSLLMVQFARSTLQIWLRGFDSELKEDEIRQIISDLKDIFIMDQTIQKVKGVIAVVKDKDVVGNEANFVKEMQTKAQETRHYDIDEDPHLFMFELFAGLYLRPNNVETLKRYKDKDTGVLCQLLMGSGKTFALLPLIALMRADGETLSTIMLPEALIPVVHEQMFERLGGDFNQMVYRFPTLSQETTKGELSTILTRLQALRKNRGCLMLSPDQKHALLNTMTALWESYTSAKQTNAAGAQEYMEQIKVASQVLELIEQNESVIGDEIDDVLRLNLQYIISIGDPIKFPEEESTLFGSTFLEIAENLSKKTFPLSEKEYDDQILPEVAQKCIDKLRDPQIVGVDRAAQFQKISPEILKDYLTIRYKDPKNIENVKKIEAALALLNGECRDQIAGLRGWALHILPTCLNNKADKDFGVLKEQVSPWAVPFNGPASPAPTNFSSPFELITYTLLAYKKQGIPHGYLASIVKDEGSCKELSKILGEEISFPEQNEEQFWEELSTAIQKDSEKYSLFLKTFLYPMVEIHKESIASDSHKLVTSSKTFSGFSGTIANKSTMPKFSEEAPDTVTEAKTINLLFDKVKSGHVTVQECKDESYQGMLDRTAELVKTNNCRALIDSGGWLAGIESVDRFAEELLDRLAGDGITSVVYHQTVQNEKKQSEGKLVCLKKVNGAFVREPFDMSSVADPHRFCMYGMRYRVGTDLKLEGKATCFMTVDPKMDFRAFIQSIFRMRQIGQDQGAVIAYSPEVKKYLSEILLDSAEVNKAGSPPLTFDLLMRLFITNQTIQVKKETYQAAQHAMKAFVEQQIREKIVELTNAGNIEQAEALFNKSKEILVTKQPGAWEQYGEIPTKISRDERIKKDIEGWKGRVSSLEDFGIYISGAALEGKFDKDALEAEQDSSDISQAGAQHIIQGRIERKEEKRTYSAAQHQERFFAELGQKREQAEQEAVRAGERLTVQENELKQLNERAVSLGLNAVEITKVPQTDKATHIKKAEILQFEVKKKDALIIEQKEKIQKTLEKIAENVTREQESRRNGLAQLGIHVKNLAVVDAAHAEEAQVALEKEKVGREKAYKILKKRNAFFENQKNPLARELAHEFKDAFQVDVEEFSQVEQAVSDKYEEEKARFAEELQKRQKRVDAFNEKIAVLKNGLNEDKKRIEDMRKASVLLGACGAELAEIDKKLEVLAGLEAQTISHIKENELSAVTRHDVGAFEARINAAIQREEESLKNEAFEAIKQEAELSERAQKLQQRGGGSIKAELERLRNRKISHGLGTVRGELTEFQAKITQEKEALNDFKKRLDAISEEKGKDLQNKLQELHARAQSLGSDQRFDVEVQEENFQAVEKVLKDGGHFLDQVEQELQVVGERRKEKIAQINAALETLQTLIQTGACAELLAEHMADLNRKRADLEALSLKTVQDGKEASLAITDMKLPDIQDLRNTVNASLQNEIQSIEDERLACLKRAEELSARAQMLDHAGAEDIAHRLQAIDVKGVDTRGGGVRKLLENLRKEIGVEKEKLGILEQALNEVAIAQKAALNTRIQELQERIERLGIRKEEAIFWKLLHYLTGGGGDKFDATFNKIRGHTQEEDIKRDNALLEEIRVEVEGIEHTLAENIEKRKEAIKGAEEGIDRLLGAAQALNIQMRKVEQKKAQGGGSLKQQEEEFAALLKNIQAQEQKMSLDLASAVTQKQKEQIASLLKEGIHVQTAMVVDVAHVVEAATNLAGYQEGIKQAVNMMRAQKALFENQGRQVESNLGRDFSKAFRVDVQDLSLLEQTVKEKCASENLKFDQELQSVIQKEENVLREGVSEAINETKLLSARAKSLQQTDAQAIQDSLEQLLTRKISHSAESFKKELTELQSQITEQKKALKAFENKLNTVSEERKNALQDRLEKLRIRAKGLGVDVGSVAINEAVFQQAEGTLNDIEQTVQLAAEKERAVLKDQVQGLKRRLLGVGDNSFEKNLNEIRDRSADVNIKEDRVRLHEIGLEVTKREKAFLQSIQKGVEQLKGLIEERKRIEAAAKIVKMEGVAIDTEIPQVTGTLLETQKAVENKITQQSEAIKARRLDVQNKMQDIKKEKIQLLAESGIDMKEGMEATLLEQGTEVETVQQFAEEAENVDKAIQKWKECKDALSRERLFVKGAFAEQFFAQLHVTAKSFSTCLNDVNAGVEKFQKQFDAEVASRKAHLQEKVAQFKDGVRKDIEAVRALAGRADAVGCEKGAINGLLRQLETLVETKVEGQAQEIKGALANLERSVQEHKESLVQLRGLVDAAEAEAKARLEGIQADFQKNRDILVELQKNADVVGGGSLGIIQEKIESKATLKETIEGAILQVEEQKAHIVQHRGLLYERADVYRGETLKKLQGLGFKQVKQAQLEKVDGQEAQYVQGCFNQRQAVEEVVALHNELKLFVAHQRGKDKELAQELLQSMKVTEVDFTQCLAIVKDLKKDFTTELDRRRARLVEFTKRRDALVGELRGAEKIYLSWKQKNEEEIKRVQQLIKKISSFDPSTIRDMTECEAQLREAEIERDIGWDSGDANRVTEVLTRGVGQEWQHAQTRAKYAFEQIEDGMMSEKQVVAECKALVRACDSAKGETNKKKQATKTNFANAIVAELKEKFGENLSKLHGKDRDRAELFLRHFLVGGKLPGTVL